MYWYVLLDFATYTVRTCRIAGMHAKFASDTVETVGPGPWQGAKARKA